VLACCVLCLLSAASPHNTSCSKDQRCGYALRPNPWSQSTQLHCIYINDIITPQTIQKGCKQSTRTVKGIYATKHGISWHKHKVWHWVLKNDVARLYALFCSCKPPTFQFKSIVKGFQIHGYHIPRLLEHSRLVYNLEGSHSCSWSLRVFNKAIDQGPAIRMGEYVWLQGVEIGCFAQGP